MPNWVSNSVVISADPTTIKEIKQFVRGIDEDDSSFEFDFRKIVPQDPNVLYDYKAKNEDSPFIDWYSWNVQFWDTKWNAEDAYITDEGEDFIQYHFDTAWYYPDNVFKTLSKIFPDAEITVSVMEETIEFALEMIYKGGKKISTIDNTEEMRKEYAEED